MANYIEFTTNHHERTLGNPIHNGKRPKSFRGIDGVRVDGVSVIFQDESIPDRLGRYFVESKRLRRRKIVNDCVAFVALMNSVRLESPTHNPFSDFDTSTAIDEASDTPLVLASRFRGRIIPTHIVLPAHLQQKQNFLHKLGDDGPLCMSNLEDSMLIMGSTDVYSIK